MMTHTAQILDGKATSKKLLETVAEGVAKLGGPLPPKLVAVLVGENPASEIYVARKMKIAAEVGIQSELLRFPADVAESDLREKLISLNEDIGVTAILVQLPLPGHINEEAVLETVAVEKDVDGFHPMNLGKLVQGIEPPALPCTPAGVMVMLDHYNIPLEGLRAAVVGRSNIVGKPISMMLTHRNATVTLCHSRTRDLDDILREADIVIAAAGKPGLVHAGAIKPGAVIVDVGINRLPDGKIVGDVDFESVKQHAGFITPVPGGVGPMTIAMLMMNTLRLYRLQQGLKPEPLLFV